MSEMDDKKLLGDIGEEAAAAVLYSEGYDIYERKYRWKRGEADIICGAPGELCLVEVKTRFNQRVGRPSDVIGSDKKERMRKTALEYAVKKGLTDRYITFKVFEVSIRQIDDAL